MWGMTVVIAGTKKDLGMTQDELTEIIEEHGGVGNYFYLYILKILTK